MADGYFRPESSMLAGYTLDYGTYSAYVQKVSLVDSSGAAVGGGGDATAANQTTEIARLTSILAKQPALGTAGTAATDVITVQGIASGTPIVIGGLVAHDAVDSGNPVAIGGYASTSAPTAVAVGDRVRAWFSTAGAQVVGCPSAALTGVDGLSNSVQSFSDAFGATLRLHVRPEGYNGATWDRLRGDTGGLVTQPYAMTGSRWGYAAGAGGISNTTTAVTIAAAAGASLRNYVTSIQINATALGAATEIAIRDGAGGTVLWRGEIGTAGLVNGRDIVFPAPLKGTANTLLEFVTLTASVTGAVYFNAQGYTAS